MIAVCVFSVWRSVQFAIADWVASPDSVQALAKAVQDSPDDPRLQARLVLARNDAGELDPGLDAQLRRAARLDPFNSEILMTLGVREEFEGDRAAAERELTQAAAIDHQFKPAWTLANFYTRQGEAAKARPMLERIFDLDPLSFDLTPVFDLCWRAAGDDPARILRLIPKRGPKAVQYLAYLIATRRTDEALRVWPMALAAVPPGSPSRETFVGFANFLANTGRIEEAVTVWNQLVDIGAVRAGHLDPAKGESIADPEFKFPAGEGFSWRLDEVPGVSPAIFGGALRVEMSTDDPESFQVLSLLVPLLPDRHYRLRWNADSSALTEPMDPGFRFRITEGSQARGAICPALLTSSACDFSSAPGDRMAGAWLRLEYTRAPGTTRISGTLGLSAVRMELIP